MTKVLAIIIPFLVVATFLSRRALPSIPRSTPVNSTESVVSDKASKTVEIVAENLKIPWELAFLPDGDILVTERPGRLLKIGKSTKIISEIKGVKHVGEGGLMGLALHPKFSENHFIYLFYTTSIGNQLDRYVLENDSLSDQKTILTGIKASKNHDGGRITFGPDGYLYVTTGDAEDPNLAQDKSSRNGKILRFKNDSDVEVYSYGHRNPQGLAWDKDGGLWASEHGPSGLQTGNDELNKITQNGNYGWPVIKGAQKKDGMITPVIESGTKDAWAPAGLAYWHNKLYFAGLRGEALYEYDPNSNQLKTYFKEVYGRLRSVVVGPDDNLYISTSNTDGRGDPKTGDDKIIKISSLN